MRLTTVALGTDSAMASVQKILPIRVRTLRARYLSSAAATSRADVASLTEVTLGSGHACIGTVVSGGALVERCLAWHTSQGSVVASRGNCGGSRSLRAEVAGWAWEALTDILLASLRIAVRSSRAWKAR